MPNPSKPPAAPAPKPVATTAADLAPKPEAIPAGIAFPATAQDHEALGDPRDDDTKDEDNPVDPAERAAKSPSEMSREELEAYVARLEARNKDLGLVAASNDPFREWNDPEEMVTVDIPTGPAGFPITINGDAYEGRKTIPYKLLCTINELLSAARQSDQARLAYRGNAQDKASVVMSPLDVRISESRTSRSGAHVAG